MLSISASSPVGSQRFVVVCPTFNNDGALPGVLTGVMRLGLPVIVVNDGSTDATSSILGTWASGPDRHVITHERNRGKAAALHTGFAKASALGFTHALTIDSDGQHVPSDLQLLIARSAENPRALIVGARPGRTAGCPAGSIIGRRLSNHFVWITSGVRVDDSQSGLRSYPLDLVEALGSKSGRYAFETEVLIRAGWAGARVVEVPISGVYKVPGGRVTHFRVGRDTWDAIRMHAMLLGRSVLPGDPVPRATWSNTTPATHFSGSTGTVLRRACWWLGPRRLFEMATGDAGSRERLAASVAAGVFMAVAPLYGVKTIVCLWLAAKFRLHPAVVIAVSSLSTPPVGFVFVFLSLFVGHTLLHGAFPTLETLPAWSTFKLADARALLWEWIAGAAVVGSTLALLSYAALRIVLRTRATPRVPGAAA
ncbi:MAG: DUF2062 domain-containing protein [Planctomycetes bacterium]|nr:DUF2062 domain-containing protein [Planctomycetota bacterium]